MKKINRICFVVLIVILSSCQSDVDNQIYTPLYPTEQFIQDHLVNQQNMLQTDLESQQHVFLSESIGLWLSYLLAIEDETRFAEQVDVLKKHFIKNDFIIWRIDGKEPSTVTALIDDLRIIETLFVAGDTFSEAKYTKLAKKLSKQLVKYGEVQGVYVDFLDIHTHEKPETITLSYIKPKAYNLFLQRDMLTNEQVEKQLQILREMPRNPNGYWPKAYSIVNNQYKFDEELHMIDQLYIGIHLAQLKEDVTEFTKWVKGLYEADEKLYGRYHAETNKPAVTFESPAVYALATEYMLEVGEGEYASVLYTRMKQLRNEEMLGYIDSETKETHFFDNALPLLIERKMDDAYNDEK